MVCVYPGVEAPELIPTLYRIGAGSIQHLLQHEWFFLI